MNSTVWLIPCRYKNYVVLLKLWNAICYCLIILLRYLADSRIKCKFAEKYEIMGRISDELNMIKSSDDNTDELYAIFKSVDKALPVIRFYMGEGSSLIRQRVNEIGKEYNLVSDLYYPPAINLKYYGRANLPFQSMFYACCFSLDPDEPLPRLLTLMETSDFFKDKESCGIERATCSRWNIKRKIELITLPYYTHYKKPCSMVKEIQSHWDDAIKSANIDKDALELVDYMSTEISKDVSDSRGYFKIANFLNYLLYVNEKTKNADGVMFPSVKAEGAGLNIVLKKESADEKIEFVGASLCYLAKNKMQSFLMIVNESTSVSKEGVITYSPKVITEKVKEEYEKYAQGLEVIN